VRTACRSSARAAGAKKPVHPSRDELSAGKAELLRQFLATQPDNCVSELQGKVLDAAR